MSSLYSTSLKTDYLDPRVDVPNGRVEFRLNADTAYYSNLRIANLGVTSNLVQTINSPAGLYSLIKHIRLLDGQSVIDELRNANRYLSFRNANDSNSNNYSLTQKIAKASVGYLLHADGTPKVAADYPLQVTGDASGNSLQDSYLDLRSCLPVLSEIAYLDTSVFKNLRVEIEYDMANSNFLGSTAAVLKTKTPLLVVDEIHDKKLVAQLKRQVKGVQFVSVEHDLVQIPDQTSVAAALAPTGSTVQQVSKSIKGFDNKLVGRIVMMKAFSDPTKYASVGVHVLGQGNFSSQAQIEERVNFLLNGSPVIPGMGLNSSAKRASYLSDAWGKVNILPFSNQTACGTNGVDSSANVVGIPTYDLNYAIESPLIGQSDYIGLDFSTRIQELSLDYQRKIVKDAGPRNLECSGLDCHIYCEVQKSLMFDGRGGYVIKYM